MKIFITGATGYIGGAVAARLYEGGHQIQALARTQKSSDLLRSKGYHVVQGDMQQPDQWIAQASQAEAFVHCAQLHFGKRISSRWVQKAREADHICFNGLLAAAKKSPSCKAIIYTSGISVVGDYGTEWTDENTPPQPGHTLGSYHWHGEQLAQSAFTQGLPVVILRPSLPVSSSGSFADFFLAKAKAGKLQFVGDGRNYCPTVHLSDLAHAYTLTIEKLPIGETLIISDDAPMTMREFSDTLMAYFGKGKTKSAPRWIVSLFAGKPLANLLVSSYRVKNDKAKRVLGWKPQYPTFVDALNQVGGVQ